MRVAIEPPFSVRSATLKFKDLLRNKNNIKFTFIFYFSGDAVKDKRLKPKNGIADTLFLFQNHFLDIRSVTLKRLLKSLNRSPVT